VMALLPRDAGDGVAESCWQWHYRGDISDGVMSLLSHADDGIADSMSSMAQCRYR
jgi:hypothetical protein